MNGYTPVIDSIVVNEVPIDILRLDRIHPHYGGNKFFKLKYNVELAKQQGFDHILTFGGANSNHIYSTAAYCKEQGVRTTGIIRGDENSAVDLGTLRFAKDCGMNIHFLSREEYRKKASPEILEKLKTIYGDFYLIPEGGANEAGVKGCTEILTDELKTYDYVFCACGTATTYSGIKISAKPRQKITGISVLKGKDTLTAESNHWLKKFGSLQILHGETIDQSRILTQYHFGGYAAYNAELVKFKQQFEKQHKIPLDYIYTSKLFYAVCDLIRKSVLNPTSKILVVHSGGLQGNHAFEERYQLRPTL